MVKLPELSVVVDCRWGPSNKTLAPPTALPLSPTTCPETVPVEFAWAIVMAEVVAALTGPTKKATAIIEASAARINVRTLVDAPSGKYGKALDAYKRPRLLEKTR